jgi:hypothetical protein
MNITDKIGIYLMSEQKEGTDAEYDAFVAKKLKAYGVDSIDDLSPADKKKFFNEIEKEWKADDE